MWQAALTSLLKSIETPALPEIRRFRRSFQAGNKQQRLLSTINDWADKAADIPASTLSTWFNEQRFSLTLGRKSILVVSNKTTDMNDFEYALACLMSLWHPHLKPSSTQDKTPAPVFSNKTQKRLARGQKRLGKKRMDALIQQLADS